MSSLAKVDNQLAVWDDMQEIKKIYANNLSQDEFKIFMQMGKSLGANPFTREIWAVKYGSSAAQIFCGRDFYRRKAQEQPDYVMHQVECIYSNDDFKVVNGEVQHSYSLSNRGNIVGAYFQLWKKNTPKPFLHTVDFKEYSTGKSLWNSKPQTMIKKVAEAQGFRMAYQGLFSGTYDESEKWDGGNEKTIEPKEDPILVSFQTNPVTGGRWREKFPNPLDTARHMGQTYYYGYDGQWHEDETSAAIDPVTGQEYVELEDGDTPIHQTPPKAVTKATQSQSDAPKTKLGVLGSNLAKAYPEDKTVAKAAAIADKQKKSAKEVAQLTFYYAYIVAGCPTDDKAGIMIDEVVQAYSEFQTDDGIQQIKSRNDVWNQKVNDKWIKTTYGKLKKAVEELIGGE